MNESKFSKEAMVTVKGSARVAIKPDHAVFNVGVETIHASLSTAQTDNAKIINKLFSVLDKQGISKDDYNTNSFSVFPEQDYSSGKPIGHRVSNSVVIKVRNIDKVGAIIDEVSSCGVNNIHGLHFAASDTADTYSRALVKAIEAAKQKAIVIFELSDTSKLTITKVKELTTNQGSFTFRSSDMPLAADSEPPIQSGNTAVSAEVEIDVVLRF